MTNKISNFIQVETSAGFTELAVKEEIPDQYVFDVLERCLQNKSLQNNSLDQKKILEVMLGSYDKKLKNINNFSENDFLLNKNEKYELHNFKDNLYKSERYLAYRYKYVVYPRLRKIDTYPPCVQIEPASICNYRCIMCYQSDPTFSEKKNNYMGYMSFDLFKKIVDEIEGHVEALTLASRGEPTLNLKFIDFLKYCKNKFLALKINTNLSTLNENLARAFFENEIQTVVVSADSATKEGYEKIRVKGNFDKILKNLELLKKIKNEYPESNCSIRVSGVKLSDDQDFELMKDIYGKYCDSIAFVDYLPWESSYENSVNEIMDPCTDLWKRIFVWYDGKINPCDYDYKSTLSKHNYNSTSIKESWNSMYYNELRSKHLKRERRLISPCNRCTNV
jgi:MoaA/NifB/PqqE/SkfB family radical SAM enzyme